MSWSPDLYIGELRPWPDSVHVVRGNTDEKRRYFPEREDGQEALERRIDELCAEVERLHADQAHWELGNCPNCPNIADLQEALEQNAKLRELVDELYPLADYGAMDASELDRAHDLMRELGVDA